MVDSMKKVAGMDVELTVEERNLLSVAYKNVIGARRASWRIISSIEQKEENKGGEDKLKMIREYRQTVGCQINYFYVKQLFLIFVPSNFTFSCTGWDWVEINLQWHPWCIGQAPNSCRKFRRVQGLLLQNVCISFFNRIYHCITIVAQWGRCFISQCLNRTYPLWCYRKGDYHRYLAEFATGNDRKEAAENSLVAYKAASDIAMTDLQPTHPIRLGLALNFSVFYYEILNSPDRACRFVHFLIIFLYSDLINTKKDSIYFLKICIRYYKHLSLLWYKYKCSEK